MRSMATPAEWIAGARPRTLPAAVAPVLTGTAVSAHAHGEVWWKAAFALAVALLLQIGVNYANDYSDGVRGTDADRVGPLRLVGSGAARPFQVKRAAFLSLGLAAVAGLVLAATTAWWLLLVGLAAIIAAWLYTGGKKPYGYFGLGEVMVFVFFGLVAVLGTTYVQIHHNPHLNNFRYTGSWAGAIGVGAIACAILVANNLRDIPTDREVGKMTLAVRLGDANTRFLYIGLVLIAVASLFVIGATTSWAALIGLICVLPLGRAALNVRRGDTGRRLVPVLVLTSNGELLYAVGVFVGLLFVG